MPEVRLDYTIPKIPGALPVLALRKGVLLPGAVIPLRVGRDSSRRAVGAARDGLLIVAAQNNMTEVPDPKDLVPQMTVARIVERRRHEDGTEIVVVQGIARAAPMTFTATTPYLEARVAVQVAEWPDDVDAAAMLAELKAALVETAGLVGGAERAVAMLDQLPRPDLVIDAAAALLQAPVEWKRQVLVTLDPLARAEMVLAQVLRSREVLDARRSIRDRLEGDARDAQREMLLRRQLKAIQDELGEGDDDELSSLRDRLEALDLPEAQRKQVNRELRRLDRLNAQSPERSVVVDWLELVADLPWGETRGRDIDLGALEEALDDSHYGLDEVKKQVLEHLAVRKLDGDGRAILLLVGPPGVGKTSIAQAVADVTDRPLVRVALGGVRDEAALRGHRRTYIGAKPGRLLEGLRRAGAADPVVVFDEVDKLGASYQGDPGSALLEVLDPEQNHAFTDHYLDMPFDLSKVLFIATANDMTRIPWALRDRMEMLTLSGYTTSEKVAIAKRHLLGKLATQAGLESDDVVLTDEAIELAAVGWTREAGVRELQRVLSRVYRAAAVRKASGELDAPLYVGAHELPDFLPRRRFLAEEHDLPGRPGIATGLAWTPTGGDVLYVEASTLPGNGQLILTGQLGDVMKESARAALTYVLSRDDGDDVNKRDVHIHVPAGAIPKDGPSAGVTMFTALASLMSDRAVRDDVAMTGEATLRGRVLPVGGIKDKVLAAHRRGIRTIILPRLNGRDLEEVPEEALVELEIVLVDHMDEVLEAALAPGGAAA